MFLVHNFDGDLIPGEEICGDFYLKMIKILRIN